MPAKRTNRASSNFPNLWTLPHRTLAGIVSGIIDVLYYDADKHCLDPDKEWDVETIEMVAQKLDNERLVPTKSYPADRQGEPDNRMVTFCLVGTGCYSGSVRTVDERVPNQAGHTNDEFVAWFAVNRLARDSYRMKHKLPFGNVFVTTTKIAL